MNWLPGIGRRKDAGDDTLKRLNGLLDSQLHFLMKIFRAEGIKGDATVTPRTDGTVEFVCKIGTRVDVHRVVDRVVEADWGPNFEVAAVSFRNADSSGRDYQWLETTFIVRMKG